MLILPYHVDVPMSRVPWSNFVIIGLTTILCFYLFTQPFETTTIQTDPDSPAFGIPRVERNKAWDPYILGGKSSGWVLHLFAHGDLLHLFGNMLFLWVFGNAVCAKVGNLVYPVLYLGLGLIAAAGHTLFTGGPAIGASGAVNGIVGMFVVWYSLNEIRCLYAFWFYSIANAGDFALNSGWMILLWFGFDIWGAVRGGGGVAYAAHLVGFAAGFLLAWIPLAVGAVKMKKGERSLADVFSGRTT